LKPFYTLLLIFNLLGITSFAKKLSADADSLKKLISPALKDTTKTPDTVTINRINELAEEYFESSPDSSTYYGNLEIKLSKKINYLKGIANGHAQLASVNTFHGDYAASTNNHNIALKLYRQLNYSHGICESYMGLGRVQDFLGNYAAAIQWYTKALALCTKTGNEADLSNCYNIIGITYDNMGEFSHALDNYFRSLFIDMKSKNELAAADKYCNIGVVMQKLELYPKALVYHNRSLRIWQKLKDMQGIGTASQNIGESLMALKNYKDAIGYLNKASAIFHKMDDREGLSLIYYDMGLYNYFTNHTDSAIYYLNLSLKSADQSQIKYNKANAYVGLAQVYNLEKKYAQAYDYAVKAQHTANTLKSLNVKTDATLQASIALAGLKRFEEAYHQHQIYADLKSDLKHNESIHKLMSYNLEVDFANKQRERENVFNQKIARQKTQNIVYAIIIVVMTILFLFYYYGKSKQQKINDLLADKNDEIISQKENLDTQTVKLNELNLLKNRLIGVLAHDLRAPISTLRGLFTLMTDAAITHEEFIEMTPKVFNKLENTSDFLDTLLFWINSQVDNNDDAIKNFKMSDLVSRELVHLDDQLKQKNMEVIINIAPDTIAFADPSSVRIVIHNFLTNAIKFSNRGSSIEITSHQHDDNRIIFILKDNGIGMNDDYLNSLFKSQVVSISGTENEIGTGLGLLFCKDLIEKYKGKIWAKSKVGVGTELCFVLPAGNKPCV
jgi:signal transduction histidine kinase/tetratricopeptide (TPR) repeat protein